MTTTSTNILSPGREDDYVQMPDLRNSEITNVSFESLSLGITYAVIDS